MIKETDMNDTTASTRTPSYQFTIPASTGRNDPALLQLRGQVTQANRDLKLVHELQVQEWLDSGKVGYCPLRSRLFVRVRGRLGPNSPHADLYRKGGRLYRRSSQDVLPEHSSRLDVYVGERIEWRAE